jgi:hypothetical protein
VPDRLGVDHQEISSAVVCDEVVCDEAFAARADVLSAAAEVEA